MRSEIDCPYWDDDWLWQHPEFPLTESLRGDPTASSPRTPSIPKETPQ